MNQPKKAAPMTPTTTGPKKQITPIFERHAKDQRESKVRDKRVDAVRNSARRLKFEE